MQHDLEAGINVDRALEYCKTLTEQDWVAMFKEHILVRPYVAVVGRPSIALGDQMRDEEKARIDAQRTRLGEEALAVCAKVAFQNALGTWRNTRTIWCAAEAGGGVGTGDAGQRRRRSH